MFPPFEIHVLFKKTLRKLHFSSEPLHIPLSNHFWFATSYCSERPPITFSSITTHRPHSGIFFLPSSSHRFFSLYAYFSFRLFSISTFFSPRIVLAFQKSINSRYFLPGLSWNLIRSPQVSNIIISDIIFSFPPFKYQTMLFEHNRCFAPRSLFVTHFVVFLFPRDS